MAIIPCVDDQCKCHCGDWIMKHSSNRYIRRKLAALRRKQIRLRQADVGADQARQKAYADYAKESKQIDCLHFPIHLCVQYCIQPCEDCCNSFNFCKPVMSCLRNLRLRLARLGVFIQRDTIMCFAYGMLIIWPCGWGQCFKESEPDSPEMGSPIFEVRQPRGSAEAGVGSEAGNTEDEHEHEQTGHNHGHEKGGKEGDVGPNHDDPDVQAGSATT